MKKQARNNETENQISVKSVPETGFAYVEMPENFDENAGLDEAEDFVPLHPDSCEEEDDFLEEETIEEDQNKEDEPATTCI